MTVTREDIEKAEGDVRSADIQLSGSRGAVVAAQAYMASLPLDDPERIALTSQIVDLQNEANQQSRVLEEAKDRLANLKREFASQQSTPNTTGVGNIPKPAPAAATTATPQGNTPRPVAPRPIAGSAQTPAPVPQGTVPPNTAEGTPAAQTTPQTSTNTSPQSEVDAEEGTIVADKTVYQLQKTWNEKAIIDQILAGDFFKPNLMNKYNNIAYQWRLFAMPDVEFLYDGDGILIDVQELYERLDGYKQVTVCETGVTGLNISEVVMDTVYGDAGGAAITNTITMKVNEPNGVQFLDILKIAAREAGVRNYMDFYYYLELRFKGYDDQGNIAFVPFSDLPNGGRWIWTVKINEIEVNLGTGGGSYRLSMVMKDAGILKSDYATTIDTMQASGETVGDMFKSIGDALTNSWSEALIRKNLIQHEFKIHGIPPADEKLLSVKPNKNLTFEEQNLQRQIIQARNGGISDEAIAAIKLSPQETDWSSIRNRGGFAIVDPNKVEGEKPNETLPTANIPRGTAIEKIITLVFGACETSQCLAKDSWSDPYSLDQGRDIINDKSFRECVTWKVIPEVRYIQQGGKAVYDSFSNRYGRRIIWHIYPHIDQSPILSTTQISKSFDNVAGDSFQKNSLAALAVRGLLSKRYDYLFTGVNTEVLNLDLNFNMQWSVTLPRIVNYYSDQALSHETFNETRKSNSHDLLRTASAADQAADEKLTEYIKAVEDFRDLTRVGRTPEEIEEERQEIKNLADEIRRLRELRRDTVGEITRRRGEIDPYVDEQFGSISAPDRNYAREQAEYVAFLEKTGEKTPPAPSDVPLFPFSFSAGDEAKHEAGFGAIGQYHAGRSIYGAVLNQSTDPAVQQFTTIEMTIRGDPFWLGESSYEQAISHNDVSHTTFYDNNRLGPNHILIRFKYPANIDTGGNVLVKDNETVTGIYKITTIKSTFTGGLFTQTITGNRLPLIQLYSVLHGIPLGEETEEANPRDTAETLKAKVQNDRERAQQIAENSRTNAIIERQQNNDDNNRNPI